MKHTKKYLDAKWVVENPEDYDERDVIDAQRYCNAYLDGYKHGLGMTGVCTLCGWENPPLKGCSICKPQSV